MGKVIMSGVSKGMTEPMTTLPNFADNTWAKIIEACDTNTVPATWEVGDQKAMTINGADYLIDIIGKNHDEYYVIGGGGAKAPLTFQLHDCYGTKYAMNNTSSTSGGWNNSVMKNTHLPALLASMPSEVRAGIKDVRKLTGINKDDATLYDSANKLFLLAEIEVSGTSYYSAEGEGTQYAYYSNGNSKIKTLNNTAVVWWLRSIRKDNGYNFTTIYNTTGQTSVSGPTEANGVAFAFCF